jgi:serine/threonine-protein kinase
MPEPTRQEPSSPQARPGGDADDPARRLWGLWRRGEQPRVDDFLAQHDLRDPGRIAAVLRVDQAERFGLGQWVRVEDYFAAFPAVRDDPELAVDLIFAEYLLREEGGELIEPEEYSRRFPEHAEELGLQLELHRAMETRPAPSAGGTGPTMVLGDRGPTEPDAGPEGYPAIPGYEVLGVLGRGGMGVVYRAWQRGLNRTVALKMVHAGAQASPTLLERFRIEAEAVARLRHANIVQIHDVGQHARSPYLVLELVEGGNLAQRVAGTPQPVRWAAELVETLARAIDAAHRQGVVHRDLTPANVLLAADGTPKITDFGLAKLLGGGVRTVTGELMGTPSYMAPEQAAGRHREIGAATDVYALGAILYELLTGRPPFKAESPLETMRQAASEEPVPPSRLRPKLARDLETICLKCLRKEPDRRYGGAPELAEDLRRFLEGRTILARPATMRERAVKWVWRRPAVAGLGAAVILIGSLGLSGILWQWREAVRARDDADAQRRQADRYARKAHQAFDEAFTQLSESKLVDVPGAQPLRRELLSGAVRYYEEFLRQRGDDPEIRGDMAAAYFRVAMIYISLERLDEALKALQQGVDFVDRLSRDYPHDPRWAGRVAGFSKGFRALESASSHLSGRLPSRPHEAVTTLLRATALWKKLARDHGDLPGFRSDLALFHLSLAAALARAKLDALALASYQDARAITEQLVRREPGVSFYQEMLTYTYPEIVKILASRRRFEEAEAVYRGGVALLEERDAGPQLGVVLQDLAAFLETQDRLHEAEAAVRRAVGLLETARPQPGPRDYRRDLAICYRTSARLAGARPPDAERFCRMAIATYEELVADFPRVATYQHERADALAQLAQLLKDSQPEEAERAYRQALLIRETVVTQSPELDLHWKQLAEGFQALISFLEARRPQELLGVCRDASARFRRLPAAPLGERDGRLTSRRLLAYADRLLAYHAAETSPAEAAEAGERAAGILKPIVKETFGVDDRENLGHADFAWAWALRHGRRFEQAEEAYDNARREFATLAEEYRSRRQYRHFLAITCSHMGGFHEARGEPARAERAYRESVDLYEQLVAEVKDEEQYQRGVAYNCLTLGRLLLEKGRFKEAEEPYRRALDLWENLVGRYPVELIHLQRCQTGLIELLLASGRADEAERISKRARDKLRELAKDYPHSHHHRVLVQWFLATCSDARIRMHDEGTLEIIEKALEAEPQNHFFRLALAASLYRAGKWDAAIDALGKLAPPNGVDSWPWFILAMAHWQRGDRDTARRWYDKATDWMKENQPRDEELRGFRSEAARLGISTATSR